MTESHEGGGDGSSEYRHACTIAIFFLIRISLLIHTLITLLTQVYTAL